MRQRTLLGVGLIALLPLVAGPRPMREIVLIARDMSFYLDNGTVPNPSIDVRRGEEIRLVFRNEDAGVTHVLAIETWDVAADPLRVGGESTVIVRAPEQPGRYEYVCRPHARMLRGYFEVR